MATFPQWWDSTKTSQITAETTGTVAAGSSIAAVERWLFNDKGALLGATTMTDYRLVVEAWDGASWVRSGLAILDQRWVQVAVTGIDNTGSGGMVAQTTSYMAIGGGASLLLSPIPQNCGRKIGIQVVVPLGASESNGEWRLVLDPVTPTAPATFTPVLGAQAGTFTCSNVQTAKYVLEGKMLTVTGFFLSCSISATPVNLSMVLPGGYLAAVRCGDLFHFSDNGTAGSGFMQITAGSNAIVFYKNINATGSWATSTNNTHIAFVLRMEIQ